MKPYILCCVALFLSACVLPEQDRYVLWETVPPASFPKLTAIGYAPLATQPAAEESQRILMAMQASKIAAYRELAEQVYGQKITANSSVADWLLESTEVKSSVSGVIRGARVVKSYPVGEHYVTELELDFGQVWALYQHQNPTQQVKDVVYF